MKKQKGETTKSIPWYDNYNKTKHDRASYFENATLESCLNAITANIIMFCVRYSPYALFRSPDSDICSKLIKEYFSVKLVNPNIEYFYIPLLLQKDLSPEWRFSHFKKEWNIISFTILEKEETKKKKRT